MATQSPAPSGVRRTTVRAGALAAVGIIAAVSLWVARDQQLDAEPSISPSPTRIDEADLFAEGVRAEIVGGDLRVAATAGGQPFLDVEEGRGVTFISSEDVDGDRWYLVQFFHPIGYLFGWLPEGSEGMGRLVRMDPAECGEPTMGWAGSLDPSDRLRCYRGMDLTLDGYVIERDWPSAYEGMPAWLANEGAVALTGAIGPAVDGPALPFHLSPGLDVPPLTPRDGPVPSERVVLVGHFDDPSSVDCRHEPARVDAPPMDPALSELWCRQQFVVESWHLSTD